MTTRWRDSSIKSQEHTTAEGFQRPFFNEMWYNDVNTSNNQLSTRPAKQLEFDVCIAFTGCYEMIETFNRLASN